MTPQIQVNLGDRSYPIRIGSGVISELGAFCKRCCGGAQALVVADENTASLNAEVATTSLTSAGYQVDVSVLPPGEKTKSLKNLSILFDQLIAMAADRDSVVIALGGGVIGDLAGFAAATFARGISFFQVPTSLLAQVDSSVGGKVAVNHHGRNGIITKNMIGAFHQPRGVLIDTQTLRSLPEAEFSSGMAEVVKYGVILDASFFEYLERELKSVRSLEPAALQKVVSRSCELKAEVVEADERERSGHRAILNYGHTFAHAIEANSQAYRHGEAVAIGMVAASVLAESLGRISPESTQRQIELLGELDLPTRFPPIDPELLLTAMYRDKKTRGGRLRFVLPTRIGHCQLVDGVDESLVRATFEKCMAGS